MPPINPSLVRQWLWAKYPRLTKNISGFSEERFPSNSDYGAYFDPLTGKVHYDPTAYPSNTSLAGILAHEMMHGRQMQVAERTMGKDAAAEWMNAEGRGFFATDPLYQSLPNEYQANKIQKLAEKKYGSSGLPKSVVPLATGGLSAAQVMDMQGLEEPWLDPVSMISAGATGGASYLGRMAQMLADPVINYFTKR